MILSDLLLSCQNQWLTGSKLNPLFTVKLVFEDISDSLTESCYFLDSNYCSNVDYLTRYRDRKVIYWSIFSSNEILVKIEGAFNYGC